MLIQEIYAREAISETGKTLPLIIVHTEPMTVAGGKDYRLLFPLRIFIDKPKTINQLFIGTITPKQNKFLAQFKDALIFESNNGRNEAIKGHDQRYFDLMAQAKYVLCPNGDFIWNYLFFEAVAVGAIPIIQDYCDLYDGFRYNCDRTEEAVRHNIELMKKRHTIRK